MNSSSGAGSATTSRGVQRAAAWTEQRPPSRGTTAFALYRENPGACQGLTGSTQRREPTVRPKQPGGGVGGGRHLTAAALPLATY